MGPEVIVPTSALPEARPTPLEPATPPERGTRSPLVVLVGVLSLIVALAVVERLLDDPAARAPGTGTAFGGPSGDGVIVDVPIGALDRVAWRVEGLQAWGPGQGLLGVWAEGDLVSVAVGAGRVVVLDAASGAVLSDRRSTEGWDDLHSTRASALLTRIVPTEEGGASPLVETADRFTGEHVVTLRPPGPGLMRGVLLRDGSLVGLR